VAVAGRPVAAAPAAPVVVPTTVSALGPTIHLVARVVPSRVRAAVRALTAAMVAATDVPATPVAVLVPVRPGRCHVAAVAPAGCPVLRTAGVPVHGVVPAMIAVAIVPCCESARPGLSTVVGDRRRLARALGGCGLRVRPRCGLGLRLRLRPDNRIRLRLRLGRRLWRRTYCRTGGGSGGGSRCGGRSGWPALSPITGCSRAPVRSVGGVLRGDAGTRRDEGGLRGLHS